MKTRILVLALLLSAQFCPSQELTQNHRLASLCKVWGFLKYYHPVVAGGKYDWDAELFNKISIVENAKSKEDLNSIYTEWLIALGDVSLLPGHLMPQTATPKNKYLTWMNDTAIFSDELKRKLQLVVEHRAVGNTHYVKPHKFVGNAHFTNEKAYKDQFNPTKEIRLLALFRYWNMIEYYFPYKYLTDKDWKQVLDEMIPKFLNATNPIEYQLAIAEMTAEVDDSHAFFWPLPWMNTLPYRTFFKAKLVDDKAVIIDFYNDSLAKLNDMRLGDVITAVNDTPISSLVDHYARYTAASNRPTLLRNVKNVLYAGGTNTMKISFERDGKSETKKVGRYTYVHYLKSLKEEARPPYTILDGNIGYVNMGVIKNKQVKKCIKRLKDTRAVILDVRNYPNGTMYKISNWLSKEKKDFVTFTQPDYFCPGSFKYDRPYNCGKTNIDPYKGKVVVLMNEETQSHAEFTCMAFKTLPNVTFIGSQTAGADGNVSDIILPGGIKFYMTGLGIYYPDGTETQRVGIVPDIEVNPTIKGLQQQRDEVMERAISFINTGK